MARVRAPNFSLNPFQQTQSPTFSIRRCTRGRFNQSPKPRTFTTSYAHYSEKQDIALRRTKIPLYPHGPARWYKQSDSGLYGGLKIASGNHVAESEARARRKWRPNIQRNPLYSEALGKTLEIKVSTRVLRTIDKVGGLDEYLLGQKSQRIKDLGTMGWQLRWELMQTPAVKARFAKERKLLGLKEEEPEHLTELREKFNKTLKPPRQEKFRTPERMKARRTDSQMESLKHQFRKDDLKRAPRHSMKKMKVRGDILGMSSPRSSRLNATRLSKSSSDERRPKRAAIDGGAAYVKERLDKYAARARTS